MPQRRVFLDQKQTAVRVYLINLIYAKTKRDRIALFFLPWRAWYGRPGLEKGIKINSPDEASQR